MKAKDKELAAQMLREMLQAQSSWTNNSSASGPGGPRIRKRKGPRRPAIDITPQVEVGPAPYNK